MRNNKSTIFIPARTTAAMAKVPSITSVDVDTLAGIRSIGTGDFTIYMSVYITNYDFEDSHFINILAGGTKICNISCNNNYRDGFFTSLYNGTNTTFYRNTVTPLSKNTWHDIVFCRRGSELITTDGINTYTKTQTTSTHGNFSNVSEFDIGFADYYGTTLGKFSFYLQDLFIYNKAML